MLQAATRVNGRFLWANAHLLFWLSLVPFATSWFGENMNATWPAAFYGFILFASATAFTILTRVLVALHGEDSQLATAIGRDSKGKISIALYLLGMGLAFVSAWLSVAVYVIVAAIWLIPDTRIERTMPE